LLVTKNKRCSLLKLTRKEASFGEPKIPYPPPGRSSGSVVCPELYDF